MPSVSKLLWRSYVFNIKLLIVLTPQCYLFTLLDLSSNCLSLFQVSNQSELIYRAVSQSEASRHVV